MTRRTPTGADHDPQTAAERQPCPTFKKCANCGADASNYVYWNPTGGWSCLACGESDYPEAAE